jgi:hypothetical protein
MSGLSDRGAGVYPEERLFWTLAQIAPSSAGFVLDSISGDVIVAVTNPAEGERVRRAIRAWPAVSRRLDRARLKHPRADIKIRPATYTFLQLKEWRDRLNEALMLPGVYSLDLDENRNRVVLGIDQGANRQVIRRLAGNVGVPEPALLLEIDEPAVAQSTLTDSIRPIAGGTKIAYDSLGTPLACSLGFPALYNGSMAFLTAAHCSRLEFGLDSTRQYQPRQPITHADSINLLIGFEVANYSPQPCPPGVSGSCVLADAAVYQFTGPPSD